VVVGVTIAEVALAGLLVWVLLRSGFASAASRSANFDAGSVVVLVPVLGCLALFVFVLAVWQWRLSGRARVRLLLTIYLSLLLSFCGFCWFDVSAQTIALASGPQAPSAAQRIVEQTAAMGLTIGALMVGLAVVAAVLWLERRRIVS